MTPPGRWPRLATTRDPYVRLMVEDLRAKKRQKKVKGSAC